MSQSNVVLRRVPKQQRSKERYDKVLASARTLIAERGNDGVSMREIAEDSAVPIGSVYQYFPDKNAILWTLMSDQFDRLETEWLAELEQVATIPDLTELSVQLFDRFAELCHLDPCFSRLWRSVQANSVLAELDRDLNKRIADATRDKLVELGVSNLDNRVWLNSFMVASLSSSALQLAFSEHDIRDDLLDEFRKLLRSQFLIK